MKDMYLQLREAAVTTCGNAFLMDDGQILTRAQYKSLSFAEKLHMVMWYNYNTNEIIKL